MIFVKEREGGPTQAVVSLLVFGVATAICCQFSRPWNCCSAETGLYWPEVLFPPLPDSELNYTHVDLWDTHMIIAYVDPQSVVEFTLVQLFGITFSSVYEETKTICSSVVQQDDSQPLGAIEVS